MPRALETDKFCIHGGKNKKTYLMANPDYTGPNQLYDGSLLDLVNYLKERNIDLAKVEIPGRFVMSIQK
jgi:hypothetical protein